MDRYEAEHSKWVDRCSCGNRFNEHGICVHCAYEEYRSQRQDALGVANSLHLSTSVKDLPRSQNVTESVTNIDTSKKRVDDADISIGHQR